MSCLPCTDGLPFSHAALLVQGGSAWVVLALTETSLDCWRVNHMGGSRDVRAQCMWSFALGVAMARFDRRTADAGALMPLRLQVQGDAVCVLFAIKERHTRGAPADVWCPALALFKLPPVSSSGVWGMLPTLPRCLRAHLSFLTPAVAGCRWDSGCRVAQLQKRHREPALVPIKSFDAGRWL